MPKTNTLPERSISSRLRAIRELRKAYQNVGTGALIRGKPFRALHPRIHRSPCRPFKSTISRLALSRNIFSFVIEDLITIA